MGTYYHLYNDTKRHEVHLDNHIKHGPITSNDAVQYAVMSYILENQGDTFRFLSDTGNEPDDYEDIDLLKYKFKDKDVLVNIVIKLNNIYERSIYKIINGVVVNSTKQ